MMKELSVRWKPTASKKTLIVIAGLMWCCVGIMLIRMAYGWLLVYDGNPLYFAIPGVLAGLIIHYYGFMRLVRKNLYRITVLPEKPCIFSFISWKSYIIIIVMISLGITLRHSSMPKHLLAVIYTGIGLGLFLSGTNYFRNLKGR